MTPKKIYLSKLLMAGAEILDKPVSDDDVEYIRADIIRDGSSEIPNDQPLPEDTVLFNKGVEEGKRLMMEDAVEGEVMTNGFYPYEPRIVAPYPNCPYDFGDKVRVIIVKEDEV